MLDPDIQAERNLILNGDFSQSLAQWKRGPVNPAYVVTRSDQLESGERMNILSAWTVLRLIRRSAYSKVPVTTSGMSSAFFVK